LLDGADISSTLFGQGSAGDLSIVGADMISLSGLTGSGSGLINILCNFLFDCLKSLCKFFLITFPNT
ncbi:MAG: hypothetical protein AAGH40_11805, partial [Verrucomicrobiota bacterium]